MCIFYGQGGLEISSCHRREFHNELSMFFLWLAAKALYGDLDMSGGRSLRKRPQKPKPALKKAGTMQNTAKEGKAFLKRSKKGGAKKKAEKIEEEEEEDQANGDAEDASD